MPEQLPFHEGHSLALDGMADHGNRPAAQRGRTHEGRAQRLVIVTIDLHYSPVEGPKFLGKRMQIADLSYISEALDFVVVDDRNQVGQPRMLRKLDRFPV